MNNYNEKLKDPRWQKKRLKILQRDNWTCQECGRQDKCLHVHHRFYEPERDPWDCEDDNLTTLCEGCHQVEYARVSPGANIKALENLFDWWVVLNNPVCSPWHIEPLKNYLEYRPHKAWRIIGIFPTMLEADLACNDFERRLKTKQKGVAS